MGCGSSTPKEANPNRNARIGRRGSNKSDKEDDRPDDYDAMKLEIQKKALEMLMRPGIDVLFSNNTDSSTSSLNKSDSSSTVLTNSSSYHQTSGSSSGSNDTDKQKKIEIRKLLKEKAESDNAWLLLNASISIHQAPALEATNKVMKFMLENVQHLSSLAQKDTSSASSDAATCGDGNTDSSSLSSSSSQINDGSNNNSTSNSSSVSDILRIKDKKDILARVVDIDSLSFESSKSAKVPYAAAGQESIELPPDDITPETVKFIIATYKSGKQLSIKSVHKLLRFGYKAMKSFPNVSQITITEREKLTVVGDIHGQLPDLLHILDDAGLPSSQQIYIFNGDFVDRGIFGVEVFCVLLSLLLAYPGRVFMNRGNHEDFPICCAYGFQSECFKKYDDTTFGMFIEVFSYIPLFATINKEVFVVHGGLFHSTDASIAELNQINRYNFSLKDIPEVGESLEAIDRHTRFEEFLKQIHRDALWSDPRDIEGKEVSFRGAGLTFGSDVVRAFLDSNDLNMVVRSHECVHSGFDQPFLSDPNTTDLLCTIFSASNYSNGGNSAAYMSFFMQSSPFASKVAKSLLRNVPSSKQHLLFSVHTYYIDPYEYPDLAVFYEVSQEDFDDTASVSSDGTIPFGASERIELLSIRQLIDKRGKVIMDLFLAADMHKTGVIPDSILSDILAHTLKIEIDFLRLLPLLVSLDCYVDLEIGDGDSRNIIKGIKYENFINCICADLSRMSMEARDHNAGMLADVASLNLNLGPDSISISVAVDSDKSQGEKIGGNLMRSETGEAFLNSLYPNFSDLYSVFSFLDVNSNGVLTLDEFKNRFKLFDQASPEKFFGMSEEAFASVFDLMDLKKDGLVDINAFFEAYRLTYIHINNSVVRSI